MFYFAHCINIIFNSLLVQLVKYDVHTTRKIKFIHGIIYDILLFSQGSIRTIFRHLGISSYMCKKILPVYSSANIIRIDTDFCKVVITNVLPPFLWFTVWYGSL